MDERNIIAVISLVSFAIVAFTPIVPVMLHHYGMDNIYVIKATIGFLTLLCGMGFVWGFFKKRGEEKKKKEGKLRFRPALIIAGVIVISLAWFTGLPLWLANVSGLETTFDFGTDTGLEGGIGTRLFTSGMTAVGVLLLKFSTFRAQPGHDRPAVDEVTYEKMLEGDRKW
jgi:putative Mn2+ efflux pump MntP